MKSILAHWTVTPYSCLISSLKIPLFRAVKNDMNIKSIFSSIITSPGSVAKAAGERQVKSQESADRDADGRQQQQEQQLKKNLTEDELSQALNKLKEIPVIKANNLSVRVVTDESLKWIVIEDPSGHVVRRLSEAQLWASMQQLDKATGQFFDKAM